MKDQQRQIHNLSGKRYVDGGESPQVVCTFLQATEEELSLGKHVDSMIKEFS